MERGRVVVRTAVEERDEFAEIALRREDVTVERVPVGPSVDVAPSVRQEDGVLIVPILEEQLVIETRLVLKEEIRTTRKSRTEFVREPVRLRSQRAEVTRLEGRDPDFPNQAKEPVDEVGLATIEPAQQGDNPSATSMGIGAAIWWALSGIVAAFAGGWVAARLAGVPSREAGMLHGVATWGAATLVVLYLLSSTGSSIIGGAFNVVGRTVSGVGGAAGGAVSAAAGQIGNPLEAIQDEIHSAANPDDPEAAGRQLVSAMGRVLTGEGDAVNPAGRDRRHGPAGRAAGRGAAAGPGMGVALSGDARSGGAAGTRRG